VPDMTVLASDQLVPPARLYNAVNDVDFCVSTAKTYTYCTVLRNNQQLGCYRGTEELSAGCLGSNFSMP